MARLIDTIVGGGTSQSGVPATGVPIIWQGGLGSGGFWGDVSADTPDGLVYIGESGRMQVRTINVGSGIINSYAGSGQSGWTGDGGQALDAGLSNPVGAAFDANYTYIADCDNQVIRRVNRTTGVIDTIAGSNVRGFAGDGGPALAAQLNKPRNVAIDLVGDLLIADTDNQRIRKVNIVTAPVGDINTVIGGGAGTADGLGPLATRLEFPYRCVVHPITGDIYWGNWGASVPGADYKVRKLDVALGTCWTVAGNGTNGYSGDTGLAVAAQISRPGGIAIDPAGAVLYIADRDNDVIRDVNLGTGIINTYAGTGVGGFSGDTGPAVNAQLDAPSDVSVDAGNNNVYIADEYNERVRVVNIGTGIINTFAGSGGSPTINQPLLDAYLVRPYGAIYDPSNYNLMYISDASLLQVFKADFGADLLTLLAGNGTSGFSGDLGPAVNAQFGGNYQLCVGPVSGNVYVADLNNNRVRVIDVGTGVIDTYAGNGAGYGGDGGLATAAGITQPISCCCDAAENLYISGYGEQRVRKVDYVTKIISTYAGGGGTGSGGDGGPAVGCQLNRPYQCYVNPAQTYLYIADRLNHRIRRVDMGTGVINRVAGTTSGFSGDGGLATAAQISNPRGVCASNTHFYISDVSNSRIRVVNLATGIIDTYAGNGSDTPLGDGGNPLNAAVGYPVTLDFDAAGDVTYNDYLFGRIREMTSQDDSPALFVGGL